VEHKILNLDKYLDAAEKDFVLYNKTEFQFLIRRDSKLVEFYSILESEIRQQSLLQVKKIPIGKRRMDSGFSTGGSWFWGFGVTGLSSLCEVVKAAITGFVSSLFCGF
jgi:hypothetical protein